ncbi:hypothetical protein M422DRAFT_245433 [Sphaerobolus stellatus SS14]|nr:hypothetical protein M422DRAFT_245433 [Sphaerobolus stellatus SS14]
MFAPRRIIRPQHVRNLTTFIASEPPPSQLPTTCSKEVVSDGVAAPSEGVAACSDEVAAAGNHFHASARYIGLPIMGGFNKLEYFARFLRRHSNQLGVPVSGLMPRLFIPIARIYVRDEGKADVSDSLSHDLRFVKDVFRSVEDPIRKLRSSHPGPVMVPFGTLKSSPSPLDHSFSPFPENNVLLCPSKSPNSDFLLRVYETIYTAFINAGILPGPIPTSEQIERTIGLSVINPPPYQPTDKQPRTFDLAKLYDLPAFKFYRPKTSKSIPLSEQFSELEAVQLDLARALLGGVQMATVTQLSPRKFTKEEFKMMKMDPKLNLITFCHTCHHRCLGGFLCPRGESEPCGQR